MYEIAEITSTYSFLSQSPEFLSRHVQTKDCALLRQNTCFCLNVHIYKEGMIMCTFTGSPSTPFWTEMLSSPKATFPSIQCFCAWLRAIAQNTVLKAQQMKNKMHCLFGTKYYKICFENSKQSCCISQSIIFSLLFLYLLQTVTTVTTVILKYPIPKRIFRNQFLLLGRSLLYSHMSTSDCLGILNYLSKQV